MHELAHQGLEQTPWSWDAEPNANAIVRMMAGNLYAGARLFRCSAWTGRRSVSTADPILRAGWALERFTFGRTDANTFEPTFVFNRDGSQWVPGYRQTFRRGDPDEAESHR